MFSRTAERNEAAISAEVDRDSRSADLKNHHTPQPSLDAAEKSPE
jgi:hypothetical protein